MWILAAFGLQALYYTLYTLHYQVALQTVNIKMSLKKLLPVLFTATFINTTAPTGGSAGTAFIVNELRREGNSAANAGGGTLLAGLVDYLLIAFLGIIGVLFKIATEGQNSAVPLAIGTAIVLALTLLIIACLVLSTVHPGILRAFLKLGVRIFHRSDKWIDNKISEFTASARLIATRPAKVILTMAIAAIGYGFSILSLWTLTAAFGPAANLANVLIAFSAGMVFWVATVTPQGLGTSEVAIIFSLSQTGMNSNQALLATLAFRGITLWVPTALGFLLMKKAKSFT